MKATRHASVLFYYYGIFDGSFTNVTLNAIVVLAHQNADCAIVTIDWLKQCLENKAFDSTDLYKIPWPSEGGKRTKGSQHGKKRIGDVSSDSENPDENEEDRAKRRQRRREAKILDVPVDGIKWQSIFSSLIGLFLR